MADLHFTDARATLAEQHAVDAVLGTADDGVAVTIESERIVRAGAARRRNLRHMLLPALHALQTESGWISKGGLNYISDRLQVPPAEAYGVASFYELFKVDDAPDHDGPVTHVCVDPACMVAGAEDLIESIGSDYPDQHVHRSPCLGLCDRAPGVFVQGRRGPDDVASDMYDYNLPQAGDPSLTLLKRIGVVDPASLKSYRDNGGYLALDKSIVMGGDRVITEISDAGLSGRGGAAFPTGIKWRAVADADGATKHIVANCDESEPGTFKDRTVMEHDPFALVEAMTIAGLATGAEKGWIYIRGEYPRATARLQHAVDEARSAGFLGADVCGVGQKFDIEIRRGAGAYICGEETALFNSIEGFRGEPRNKPPFPTTNGLFDQPTAINNPETLLNVLPIILDGAAEYRKTGTERSPGPRLFCLSGHVAVPGLYELPFGATLREVLAAAGGVAGNGEMQAILMGGAAGMFATEQHLDLPLTLEDTREAGITLGSGVVMVFDTTVDLMSVCVRIAEFFKNESCGQCVPCRVGAVRQHEMMVELSSNGRVLSQPKRDLHEEMHLAMADASICGLGHTAASAIRSALSLGLIGSN